MFPGMNSRKAKRMMKQMGIDQEELPAKKVVIELEDKKLVIGKPSVSKINMKGKKTFQVSGKVREESLESFEITDDDLETVMDQTSCSEEEAEKALKKTEGDIAEAIMQLSE